MQTKTEKIITQGGKTMCDNCHRLKNYGAGWMMSAPDKSVICPDCVPEVAKSGKTLVGL